jgi:Flp pilus assembly protein TadG
MSGRTPTAISARVGRRRDRHGGQSLVEFALVFPLFITMIMGLIEFGFVFNALLSVNYAARDAALAAAEAGNGSGSDCVILASVEAAVGAPTSDERILEVEIYRADADGDMVGSPTVFERADSITCTFIDGSTSVQPYRLAANGYPELSRCNYLGGCVDSDPNDSVDIVGVRITYQHVWVTPLHNFIGGGAGGLVFDRSSVMRMEPVL